MNEKLLFQDIVFRRVVVGSTCLALAGMIGSLASIQISKSSGLQFQWHWSIILWIGAVLFWNKRLWNLIWRAQTDPSSGLRRKIVGSCVILACLGFAAFLYPIRFIAESYRPEIGRGLITAILFLGTLAGIVFKFGQGFLEQDAIELKRNAD